MTELEITGTDKLIKHLKAGYEMTDVKKSVKKYGAELQERAQRHAPVGEYPRESGKSGGTLKRSIELDIRHRGFTAAVAPGVDYASYPEYGTRFMTAKPYMRPAFNEVKHQFKSDMLKMVE